MINLNSILFNMVLKKYFVICFLLSLIVLFGQEEKKGIAVNTTVDKIAKEITVRIEGTTRGTGILIERRGTTYTILTNAHVVKKAGQKIIVTPDSKCYAVESNQIRLIPNLDLAILQFASSKDYPLAQLGNATQLRQGNIVYVGGWARAGGPLFSRVFLITEGKLTKVNSELPLGYSLTYTNLIRVGMSGAPILTQQGKVVGINGLVRLVPNSNEIVASGININQFVNWRRNRNQTLPVISSSSAVTCHSRYLN
ncbi:MAG: trypsin-like peptidase domain-containing protein [Moorea sp. SIO2B7]|nr:trypsin-like peptidase domain-containing protein [Moorena sp. SIO2B7]